MAWWWTRHGPSSCLRAQIGDSTIILCSNDPWTKNQERKRLDIMNDKENFLSRSNFWVWNFLNALHKKETSLLLILLLFISLSLSPHSHTVFFFQLFSSLNDGCCRSITFKDTFSFESFLTMNSYWMKHHTDLRTKWMDSKSHVWVVVTVVPGQPGVSPLDPFFHHWFILITLSFLLLLSFQSTCYYQCNNLVTNSSSFLFNQSSIPCL